MKKFFVSLVFLMLCCVKAAAYQYINGNIYPFPMKITPRQIELKGDLKNFEMSQVQYWGRMSFGEPTKQRLEDEEFFKFENGVLTMYMFRGGTKAIKSWVLHYNDKQQIDEAVEIYDSNGDKTDVYKSKFIYTYTNNQLTKVEHRRERDNSIQELWKISYEGDKQIVNEYDDDGMWRNQYVYTNGYLTLYAIIYYQIIDSVTKYEYDKFGKCLKMISVDKKGESTTNIKYNKYGWNSIYSYKVDRTGNWIEKCGTPSTPNGGFYIYERQIKQ